jgi:hypothetical protein
LPGARKPLPIDAFELTMDDARQLLKLVGGFTNERTRRMRAELRDRVGEALRIPAKERPDLDCLESGDVFLVFLPGSTLRRDDFSDARPLLRQAIVAGCAAFETYIGDKAMASVGALVHSAETLTPRLRRVPLTLADFIEIEEQYQRTGWGIRHRVVEPYVREAASTAPNKVGNVLSAIGVENWAKKVDGERRVPSGETERFLERLTARRNKIAHEGDRLGRSRGDLTVDEVRSYVDGLESIVKALEVIIE